MALGAANALRVGLGANSLGVPFMTLYAFSLIFSVIVPYVMVLTQEFLKEKESLRILRLASGASGFQIKRKARSAAAMPNKAANPAETHRLSETHSVSRGEGSLS